MTTNTVFISEMVRLFPEIKPFYDKSVAADRDFLPRVFMMAAADFVRAEVNNPSSQDILQRLLAYLEEGLTNGSPEDREGIVSNFVHDFIGEDSSIDAIKPMMGPNLREKMEYIYGVVGELDPTGTMGLFIEELLQKVPELKPVYDGHLAENGELLPHAFMSDLTRFVIAEAENPASRDVLERLLGYLEKGLTVGSEHVQEMIVVSFVESLIDENATIKAIESLMGPNLRKEVKAICGM